jgi:putative component of toxin-antitoxin plasmid stabilization module
MNLYATPEFKDRKYLGDDLFELRWRNGRRAYFSMMTDREGQAVLMLLGGGKNGQNRDISAARKILEREAA